MSIQTANPPETDLNGLEIQTPLRFSNWRIRVGLGSTLLGFLIFMIGARPGLFGLDRSPVIGFVQIATMLIGLAIICIGGHTCIVALWRKQKTSIAADIGLRLVATGYVIAIFSGMADVFGIGSHTLPLVPYFGAWQVRGIEIGQTLMCLGFLLMVPPANLQAAPEDAGSSGPAL